MDAEKNEFVNIDPKDREAIEKLKQSYIKHGGVPNHWEALYSIDELVEVKGYWFTIKDIGAKRLILTPHGPAKSRDLLDRLVDEEKRQTPSLVVPRKGPIPRVNVYNCGACGEKCVTVDVAEGVTPFMIPCNEFGTEGCKENMQSSFYRIPKDLPRATYEWFRPTKEEVEEMSPMMQDHIKQGGLDIRPRTEAVPVFHKEK